MHRLRTVTSLDVSAVAGHYAMPAALLLTYTLFSKNCDAFLFWAVYNCNVGIKRLEEKSWKQSLTQIMPLSLSDTR